ncbi:retrovirus-related pol polyprotein from transposon TNT 1-94 [Tanacetum coccineum]
MEKLCKSPHTSLKALDEGYSSKNYVRKFLRALHPKWREKVTAIKESKDLTSLDELIGNLKVHEMIIKKDSEIFKEKVERKSIALKAKKKTSDQKCSTSGSEDEEYAMANHLIGECPKPPKDKNQRDFFGGSWSDSGEEDKENIKNETCLVAHASSEICLIVDLEPDEWIKDSRCSKHMTGIRKLFSTYKAYNDIIVPLPMNLRGNIIGKGTISNDSLKIDNVEHVDNLGFNLLSIGQICDNKCRVTFSEHDSEITKDGRVIGRGIRKKGLYVMKLGNKPKDQICLVTIDENSTLWHRRLGHANMHLIQSLASKELVRNLPKLKFDQHFCDACKIGKQAHASHKAKNIVSVTRCLELLHMDLFGPSAVRSYRGNRYTLVIVDDYSRYTWTRFLKDKTEAFDQFEILSRKIQNQLGCSIVSIRTDHGREFDNEVQFGEFCNANGITHNFSAPRTPQSNGVVERKNRTLQEMSRTMLNEQSLPQKFWCNAVDTSTYILNRILIRAILGKTPYELLRGLVAQGYNQQEGIDYDETYAPVARLESSRILLAYACALDFNYSNVDGEMTLEDELRYTKSYVPTISNENYIPDILKPVIRNLECRYVVPAGRVVVPTGKINTLLFSKGIKGKNNLAIQSMPELIRADFHYKDYAREYMECSQSYLSKSWKEELIFDKKESARLQYGERRSEVTRSSKATCQRMPGQRHAVRVYGVITPKEFGNDCWLLITEGCTLEKVLPKDNPLAHRADTKKTRNYRCLCWEKFCSHGVTTKVAVTALLVVIRGWDDSAFSVFTTNSEEVEGRPLFNRFAKADSMKASSTSGDSNSMSNDFVSWDNSDKSLEVNTNDFASSDSSVKSSEPKSNDSTQCASTS